MCVLCCVCVVLRACVLCVCACVLCVCLCVCGGLRVCGRKATLKQNNDIYIIMSSETTVGLTSEDSSNETGRQIPTKGWRGGCGEEGEGGGW